MNVRSIGAKALWALRVLAVRLRFIGLMVLVALLVASWDTILVRLARLTRPDVAPDSVGVAEHEYYCPMHPNVIRGEPASCPICGMPLSKRKKGAPEALPDGVLARVQLAPNRVRLAGVATTPIARRPLERVIDTVGTVDVDERRLARISARVAGRVDELFVDFTGIEVKAGAPLAKVYSQDLFTSSRELLLAQKQGGPLLAAARQRLLLWGLSDEQIDAMVAAGEPTVHVTVPSPISGTVVSKSVVAGDYVQEGAPMYTVADLSVLWMIARVFEDEAPLVHFGQKVDIRASAYPDRVFEGFVSFIDPRIDPRTRTVGVRVDVPNTVRLLRPGMYVRASLRTPIGPSGRAETGAPAVVYRCCAACPEIESTSPGDCPKCGMPLTPVEQAASAPPAAAYVCRCPMHPDREFRAAGPGACGLCGAALVPEGAAPVAPAPSGPETITLYECPGHPDMTLDHPGICTKCGTMELIPRDAPAEEARELLGAAAAARGEAPPATAATDGPVHPLAVPSDAVIDTGTRQVVYRRAEEGVYDAVEVKLGPRSGDFYPVISGLRAGDHVVTRGAFLVDAEARLSPAATSNYFGASGSPTDGHGGGH